MVVAILTARTVCTRLSVDHGPSVAQVCDVLARLADSEARLAMLGIRRHEVEGLVAQAVAEAPALDVLAIRASSAPPARERVVYCVWRALYRAHRRPVRARGLAAVIAGTRAAAVLWNQIDPVVAVRRARHAVEDA